MNLIKQNPYHVIGILAGANQRTLAKQRAKINAFQKVGKSIEFDTDLLFPGNPDRSEEAINKAFADIQINQNRLLHALFWLVNHNHLDETALNYLQAGDLDKTEEIWQKTTRGKDITSRNFSAFNNLGTLKIALAFSNGSIDLETLMEGIHLKTKLITSDTFKEFCHWVADETYTVDNNKELENFIMNLIRQAEKSGEKEAKEIPSLLAEIHPKLRSIVSEKLTERPINNIERKIYQTAQSRNESPENAFDLAGKLFLDTNMILVTLYDLLGKNHLKYKMVADKLAKELLQCGIDYFKEYQDDEDLHDGDFGSDVMKIFKISESIAVGNQTIERIAENIDGLQEWIDNADERRLNSQIGDSVDFIVTQLNLAAKTLNNKGKYPTGYNDPYSDLPKSQQPHNKERTEADDMLKYYKSTYDLEQEKEEFNINLFRLSRDIVEQCKPKLATIENVVGRQHKIYINLSNELVSIALACLIEYVNNGVNSAIAIPPSISEHVLRAMNAIGSLEMKNDMRERYNTQKQSLWNLKRSTEKRNSTSSSSSSGGGCYIATMAYGSYEHPQVIELRKFRDETLSKSISGRGFINMYYWLSPKLVKLLKGNTLINSLIRNLLSHFIKHIK